MKRLNLMLHDEKIAPRDYTKLKNQLKSKRDKRIIQGIIRQERSHYRKLIKMKRRLK